MSQSTEIIDITPLPVTTSGEPVLPIVFKGRHTRFVGWVREYTIIVNHDALTIEGPFQDDNPNAKEYYQVSQSIAHRWIIVRYGTLKIRIPGRGRWGIDVSDNPDFELLLARLLAWMSNQRGKEASERVDEELRQFMYLWPAIYSILQMFSISGAAILVSFFGSAGPIAAAANLTLGLLFVAVFVLISVFRHRAGLFLGIALNCFMLALPLLDTYFIGEKSEALGFSFPLFVPFCLSPTAVLIPLAMGAYGAVLLEHPRLQNRII